MSNLTPVNKEPIKIYYKRDISIKTPNNNFNKINSSKIINDNYHFLNKKLYAYPICIYKKPNEQRKYQERIILSAKPTMKKTLINKYYHHLKFKSHSEKILLNKTNSNINENNINIFNKKCNKSLKNLYTTRKKEIKSKNRLFYKTFYDTKRSISNINIKSRNDNDIYKKLYLSEVEKRGCNYNKLKISSLQKKALDYYNKFNRNNLELKNGFNNENKFCYILCSEKISNSPTLKNYFINKFRKIKMKTMLKKRRNCQKNEKPKGVINIKNDPNFKFHIFHDRNGNPKVLDKPYERALKMTETKLRDLKLMIKIRKLNDPEIIQMYQSMLQNS